MRTLSLLLFAAAVGCGAADSSPAAREGDQPHSADAAGGEWIARAGSGAAVRVRSEPSPPRPGLVRFVITLEGEPAGGPPRTLDLVSPSMPTHGVLRFPVERERPGVFVAEADIPMEGRWVLYVNLDDTGGDAASFEFDVPAVDGRATHAH